jgi:hypothetical protein
MKKVLIHLSMLCLLAALVMPLTGCKKEEEMEAEPAVTEQPMEAPAMTESTEPMSTEPMSTEPMSTEPMGTEVAPPPAQ